MTDEQARRNKQMGDWIRQGISAPSMPLELPPPEPQEPEDRAAAPPSALQLPGGIDGGAGTTQGPRPKQRESMNDLIRRGVRDTRHGPSE
jgi:hypothetical protein